MTKLYYALFALLSLASVGCSNAEEASAKTPDSDVAAASAKTPGLAASAKTYPTEAATIADISQPIMLTGRVVPLQEATIATQVPGLVLPTGKILQEGTAYRKGEVILAIDDKNLRMNLRAARAEFASALVRLLPTLSLDHPQAYASYKAFADGIDPAKPLPALPTPATETLRYYLAVNGVDGQYYRIKAQEATLEDFVVRAPFSGKLTMASVQAGSIVQPGQPLATLSRTDEYEVRLAVPNVAVALVRPGSTLALRDAATGKVYRGRVNRFATDLDAGTQTLTAFARVSGAGLYSGLYLEAELDGQVLTQVAVLPKQALTRDGNVYVVADSTVQVKPVTVALIEADKVYLRGLAAGDRVIVAPLDGSVVGTRAL